MGGRAILGPMGPASEPLVEALRAITRGDLGAAVAAVDEAVAVDPDSRLAPALRAHLAEGRTDVYTDPEAFALFIDGGGNVGLYEHAGRALAAAHAEVRPQRALDIGCGEGRLTSASLREGLHRLDLVEPSAELLAAACRRLEDSGVEVVPHQVGAEEVATVLAGARWGVAQSTFALHTMAPDVRGRVLRDLATRVDRLLLVEFDCPALTDRGDAHLHHLVDRYEVGLAEYVEAPLVASGFLMPVLVGQLDPAAERHTWEQPATAWVEELRAAGFATVTHREISPYWWAPAHLIEGLGHSVAGAPSVPSN